MSAWRLGIALGAGLLASCAQGQLLRDAAGNADGDALEAAPCLGADCGAPEGGASDGDARSDGPPCRPSDQLACDGRCLAKLPETCCTSTDCPAVAPVCTAEHLCVGRAVGAACTTKDECASGACVGKICCDDACAKGCTSCMGVDTGHEDGTCAPVRMGQAHGQDCAMTTESLCGTTGACDGTGACQFWPRTVQCAPLTCAAGDTIQMAPSMCDGQGRCVPGELASCDAYTCNAATASCRTTCASASDCAPGYFCGAGFCGKKAVGQACASSSECQSLNCGGLCCRPGEACNCPTPGPQNVLHNPGFDKNNDGWTFTGTPSEQFQWDGSSDASGCKYSGALDFWDQGDTPSPKVTQCVALQPTTMYAVGGRLSSDCGTSRCELHVYDGDDCTGNDVTATAVSPLPPGFSVPQPWTGNFTQWSDIATSAPWLTPGTTRSGMLVCTFTENDCDVLLDNTFVSTSPFKF